MKTILVTGGTGYIGSHTCVELLQAGYRVVVTDNLSNSSPVAIERIRQIVYGDPQKVGDIRFYLADIADARLMRQIMEFEKPEAVIHFAGLKAVGESVEKPLEYYENNVAGTTQLLKAMDAAGVKKIVFSSSATVYGDAPAPYTEDTPKGFTSSPYGWTKWMIEQILEDVAKADPEWKVLSLRYFNPIGAHPSGLIGEDPKGIPNNLLPYVSQVAVGRRPEVHVFGNDYPTEDGTCRRDYLHVVDLAIGHIKALEHLDEVDGFDAINLGTGTPTSVLEILDAFSKACGHQVPYVFDERREGDLPEFWACADKAAEILGWTAPLTIEDMCADAWKWQSMNPEGFGNGD